MRTQVSLALLLLIVVIIAACQPAADTSEADKAAIRSMVAEWCTAAEAGDVAAAMALYADDIVRFPPDKPTIKGKPAIEAVYRGAFELFTLEVTWPVAGTEEIVVADGWAFYMSEYIQLFTPKAEGDAFEDRGKIIEVCRQQPDGTWKFAREIWNRNSPPGEE